jgi:hypothetical protein
MSKVKVKNRDLGDDIELSANCDECGKKHIRTFKKHLNIVAFHFQCCTDTDYLECECGQRRLDKTTKCECGKSKAEKVKMKINHLAE